MKKITIENVENKLKAGDFVYDEFKNKSFGKWGILLKNNSRAYLDHVGWSMGLPNIICGSEEYETTKIMFLDDLDALNLTQFLNNPNEFDVEKFTYEIVESLDEHICMETVEINKKFIEKIVDARILELMCRH
jgi:hypothetical protein